MKAVLAYVAMVDDHRATLGVDMSYAKGEPEPSQEQAGAQPSQTETIPGAPTLPDVPVAAPAPMDTDDVVIIEPAP